MDEDAMKICSWCDETKPLAEFYSHLKTNKATGEEFLYFFPYCKNCNSQKKRDKERTRDGIANTLYLSQRLHSKKRGYVGPAYTLEELRTWLHAQPQFESLFTTWEASGYLSDLKPSCNRLNDYEGYSLNNIELVTWKENKEAWARDCVAGKNRKISRPVQQFSAEDEFIQEYFSIQEASRQLAIPHGNIVKACTGERNAAGGFKWRYTDPTCAPKRTGFVGGA